MNKSCANIHFRDIYWSQKCVPLYYWVSFITFAIRLRFSYKLFFTESLTNHVELLLITGCGRMVSELHPVSSGLGSSPGRGHCVMF